ncbi:MAG: SgcJ/EcaC family oxidoreductase [Acetobacteraceae bacterium]|nr:SgcJ/EcaC family oxidoreductase [Acetobacteraceae bacterium]MBV8574782.1 SgcJ/EcaC family oxidoreductase [Acetobacteraceae bacterium]
MTDDEEAIRDVVTEWMSATRRGDLAAVMALMTDDVVFIVPGQEPFGKAAFAEAAARRTGVKIDGVSDILELRVLGDWAFIRNRIEVAMTGPGGPAQRLSGYTLTLFQKGSDGQWRVARDANLVRPSDGCV